jgi:hypothetical protein
MREQQEWEEEKEMEGVDMVAQGEEVVENERTLIGGEVVLVVKPASNQPYIRKSGDKGTHVSFIPNGVKKRSYINSSRFFPLVATPHISTLIPPDTLASYSPSSTNPVPLSVYLFDEGETHRGS